MSGVTRVSVIVTFLRLDGAAASAAPLAVAGLQARRLAEPSVSTYRQLYSAVGGSYLWWLRRTVPDWQIAAMLRHPRIGIHVLYQDDDPVGFFELDSRSAAATNLSYFGLMPHAIGRGLGGASLRRAIDAAFGDGARALTVNTCTADHPRALATYLGAGFKTIRSVRELWDVPNALGMTIPEHLKV